MNVVKTIFFIGAILIGLASFRTAPVKNSTTASVSSVTVADTGKIDAETGLINDPSLMMVKAQCTACHSSKLILQHRFTRAGWVDRIRWMQKYHKLWDLGDSEKVVLDYLEKHYGPETAATTNTFRRQSLKNVQWYKLDK
ncbi:hypothetical protein [Spirosoma endophyticum]|uniref:Sulfite dehydrogenase (Cytochrome) subunit SorB n=1 Tax=Spirosoma endophyticum TaxID=662367 RepID=A0A1I1RSJ8_9BACT|nr:hypothetical protein [Spirosoma endophyticum]SFD33550.1 hypothetical protein SAMN05216167_104403 [Spirosoma endophyticum]